MLPRIRLAQAALTTAREHVSRMGILLADHFLAEAWKALESERKAHAKVVKKCSALGHAEKLEAAK